MHFYGYRKARQALTQSVRFIWLIFNFFILVLNEFLIET